MTRTLPAGAARRITRLTAAALQDLAAIDGITPAALAGAVHRMGDLARSVNDSWRDRKLTIAEIEEIEARCHATNAETAAILATCAHARAEHRRTGGSR